LKGSQYILLNLPVPSENLLWGAISPTLVDEVVPFRPTEPFLLYRYGLFLDFSDHVSLPMGNMR
jgi:hypothetical protein